MSDSAWNNKQEHSQQWEKRQLRRIRAIQKRLLQILVAELTDALTLENGQILNGETFQSSIVISDVFNKFSKYNEDSVKALIREMMKSSNLNADYFKAVDFGMDRFVSAEARATKFVLKALGLKQKGDAFEIIRNGFIDTIVDTRQYRTVVTRIITESVIGGEGFTSLRKNLANALSGSNGRAGLIERHYNLYAFDTLQQVDRVQADIYAQELGLTAFIFSGTVIENTRCFCKDNVGKVILKSEAKKWKKITGKKCGPTKKVGYKPIRDLGGNNCRHNARFISPTLAARRREDLYVDENGNLKKKK